MKAEELIRTFKPGLPRGALVVKYWRNAIWVEHRDDSVRRDQRLKVVAKEQRADLRSMKTVDSHRFCNGKAGVFSRFGKGDHRWVDV